MADARDADWRKHDNTLQVFSMILRDSLRNLLLITKNLGENLELLRDNL